MAATGNSEQDARAVRTEALNPSGAMDDLIARLEKAPGPDQELDCEIHGFIHWPKGRWEIAQIGEDRFSEIHWTWALLRHTTDKHIVIYRDVRRYTSGDVFGLCSITPDLVSVIRGPDRRYKVCVSDVFDKPHTGEGLTEAIARLIATLKARAVLAKAKGAAFAGGDL